MDENKPKPPAPSGPEAPTRTGTKAPTPAGPGAPGPRPGASPGDEAHAPERQRTIDILCEAFANDEIEVEEFERRVEAAHRASSAEALRHLLSGLPSASVPAPTGKKERFPAPAPRTAPPRAHVPARSDAPAPSDVPAPFMGEVREWSLSMGFMGGNSHSGYWVPARKNVVIGVMGGCELDLREAQLAPGVTEIFVFAFLGGVEVVVPPWLQVEVSGIGIMGGFEHRQSAPPAYHPGAPVVRISGVAMMGGATVSVRYPGESTGDARRRVKEERKAKKLGRGRDPDEERG